MMGKGSDTMKQQMLVLCIFYILLIYFICLLFQFLCLVSVEWVYGMHYIRSSTMYSSSFKVIL